MRKEELITDTRPTRPHTKSRNERKEDGRFSGDLKCGYKI